MIIIGWPNCKTCKILKEKYPNLEYIEIQKKATDDRMRQIKLLIGKNHLEYFPILVNDALTEVISMSLFDMEFAISHPNLF